MKQERRKLVELIRAVSAQHGGDSPAFLKNYIAEILSEWENNLSAAIACFENLRDSAIKAGLPIPESGVKPDRAKYQGHGAFSAYYADKEEVKG